MEKAELIQQVVKQYDDAKKLQDMQEPTFLSVIGKAYHENYLSRLIAYALKKDKNFLRNLLGFRQNFPVPVKLGDPTVEYEKYMDGSRADIFIVIPDGKITVTIENKTDTWEHDDQTRAYYDWVEKEYPKYTNYFFYLCPNYNPSTPSCKAYKTVTYAALADMIPKDTDDPIIRDLKKHSEDKLGVNNMGLKNYDIKVIKHYDELTKILSEAKQHIADYQNAAIEEIKEKLMSDYRFYWWKDWDEVENKDQIPNPLLIETDPARGIISSYRLYKPEWYERDLYYFYVEILFVHEKNYGDIRGIRYQRTLKVPTKNEVSITEDRLREPGIKIDFYGQYGVLESLEPTYFSGDDIWENPDENWKEKFITDATKILPRLLETQSEEFEKIKGVISKPE